MRKRIAIINQRYGVEVNGGSEYYTKKLAEHLNEIYDVEVLTTTALDYDTWAPYFAEGEQIIDGVRVRRFDVDKNRDVRWFKIVNKLLVTMPWVWRMLEPVWQKAQGPFCPKLIRYIQGSKDEFDIFIFVTYLYYTTVAGLPGVSNKAILVPTAHDEYCIYFSAYKKIFTIPKGIVYLTEEEQKFVEKLFGNSQIPHVVAGAGIDVEYPAEPVGNSDMYFVYVGRIDTSKNCDQLFEYFGRYKKCHKNDLKLVAIGKAMMIVPEHKDIIYKGFIEEDEKNQLINGAIALIMPSEHESLSLSVLEAMALGVPVIVNGNCEVLKAHCRLSGAGLWYYNYKEFEKSINELLKKDESYENRTRLAVEYIKKNFSWKKTVDDFKQIIEQ
ncbi:MAG: glycosyltransferase family 4 protein [Lachnospiraceae bacterium]